MPMLYQESCHPRGLDRPMNEGLGGRCARVIALGATEKTIQQILRHSKPQLIKEGYVKAFDSEVIRRL